MKKIHSGHREKLSVCAELLLSIVLAFLIYAIFWKNRFFYDDEWFNLKLIANYKLPDLLAFVSNHDIHPPLSYIVNYYWFKIAGSNEFFLTIPSLVFTALTAFIAARIVRLLTGVRHYSCIVIVLTLLHPNILLFGWSIRWYPLWTLLTVAALYLVLQLCLSKTKKYSLILQLIFVLSAALYTNYQSFLLMSALILLTVFMVTRNRLRIPVASILALPLAVSISVILFLPWIGDFLLQLNNYLESNHLLSLHNFRAISFFFYGVYSLFVTITGASTYPWLPGFILPFSLTMISLFLLLILILHSDNRKILPGRFQNLSRATGTFAVLVLSIYLLFLLHAQITLNHKARGYSALSILFIIALILIYNKLKSLDFRKYRRSIFVLLHIFVASIILIWFSGDLNIFNKRHLHKMGLSDPVLQLAEQIGNEAATSSRHLLITCLHPSLSYYLLWQENNSNYTVSTPYRYAVPDFIDCRKTIEYHSFKPDSCEILTIDSFPGAFLPRADNYYRTIEIIESHSIALDSACYGKDYDFRYRSKMFPASKMDEWRIQLKRYLPPPDFDFNQIAQVDSLCKIWQK